MDFEFNKEQKLIKNMITEFANNEVKPYAADIDQIPKFPNEFGIIDKLGKLGVMGMSIPKKYGGSELSNISISSLPASIFEKSRMSFINCKRLAAL